jgi:peptidoglycan-associated lipoprotein
MPAPTVDFSVEPERILRGEQAQLRWTSENGTTARISPAIGSVGLQGMREVSPTQDTTYTLAVEGAGGVTTKTVRLAIVSNELPSNRSTVSSENLDVPFDSVVGRIRDVYFDYDASGLRPDMEQVLIENGRLLMDLFSTYSDGTVLIEGHCDERGTNEYNLALGDRRAAAVKEFLTAQGVPADRMRTVSLGEERPQCFEAAETCWSRNRRAHFTPLP